MSSPNIVSYRDLDAEKITITKPEKDGDNFIFPCEFEGKEDFYIKSPKMIIKKMEKDADEIIMSLAFLDKGKSFYSFLREIEKKTVETIHKNSTDWLYLPSQPHIRKIRNRQISVLELPMNLNDSPLLNVCIPSGCHIFKGPKQMNEVNFQMDNSLIILFHIEGIQFDTKSFGYYLSIKPLQIKIMT